MPGPVGTTRIVGRERDLAILESALDDAGEGRPSITLVVGEYGIGKTRLMRELEARAQRRRIGVLAGESVPLEGGELPYGPISSGLRNLPPELLAVTVEQLPRAARAQLAAAFPQLPAPDEPGPAAAPAGELEQARFYEYLLGLLQALSAAAPLLIIIEDFRWADSATRNFVRFLVRNLRRQCIALVLTDRIGDGVESERLWAEDLAKRAERIELTGLDREAIGALLAAGFEGPPPRDLVDEVFRRSAGNPFFAEELVAARLQHGSGEPPATLRDAALTRVRRLPPDAQRVVLAAAAVARACGTALLGGAAELGEPALSRAVREALDGHVLEQLGGGDAFQFRHDVVREVVYRDLLPGQRAGLHARIAATLAERRSAVGPGELAYHWRAAGDVAAAVAASLDAARAASEAHAYSEALGHFERVLELVEEAGGLPAAVDLDRAELLRRAAETARYAGEHDRAAALAEQGLRQVDAVADPARAAALHELIGHCQSFGYEAALRAFRTAIDLLPASDDAGRARLLGAEANALLGLGTWRTVQEGSVQAAAAVELATRAGARAEEAYARIMLGLALAILGRAAEGAEQLRSARATARELGRAEDVLRAHLYLGEALRLAGDFASALAVMDEGRALAVELGMDASFGRYMALNSAEDRFLLGRWEGTRELLEEARVERDPTSWNRMLWSMVAGKLALARGDLAVAEEELGQARAVHEAEGRPPEYAAPLHAGLAELSLARRDPEAARAEIRTGCDAVADQADLLYAPALFSVGARVEAEAADAGQAARADAAGRAAELRDALAAMLPSAPRDTPPPSAVAHLALCRAETARAAGASDGSLWEEAAARWEAVGAPYEAAYARAHHAEALLQSRGDPAAASGLLSRAYDAARELGAAQLRVKVELLAGRDLVHLRVRSGERPPEPAAPQPAPGFDLTAREREVLALVAAGLTNRAIAERLVISEKTAGIHVSHIFAKLGVHDRRVAATRAYQLGLAGPPPERPALDA